MSKALVRHRSNSDLYSRRRGEGEPAITTILTLSSMKGYIGMYLNGMKHLLQNLTACMQVSILLIA